MAESNVIALTLQVSMKLLSALTSGLESGGDAYTLSKLQLLSKASYSIVTPHLCRRAVIKAESAEGLLCIADVAAAKTTFEEAVARLKEIDSPEDSTEQARFISDPQTRRLRNLRYVEHLTVHTLPPQALCNLLLSASWSSRNDISLPDTLFPRLETISFSAAALVLPTGIQMRWHPFFVLLGVICAPKHVDFAFPHVDEHFQPTQAVSDWLQHCIDTVASDKCGKQLQDQAKRLQGSDSEEQIATSPTSTRKAWSAISLLTRLESMTISGDLSQTLPCLSGIRHQYFFNNPCPVRIIQRGCSSHMSTPHIIRPPPTERLIRATFIRDAILKSFIHGYMPLCRPGCKGRCSKREIAPLGAGSAPKRLKEPICSFEFVACASGLVETVPGETQSEKDGRVTEQEAWIKRKIRGAVEGQYGGDQWVKGTLAAVQSRIVFVSALET